MNIISTQNGWLIIWNRIKKLRHGTGTLDGTQKALR